MAPAATLAAVILKLNRLVGVRRDSPAVVGAVQTGGASERGSVPVFIYKASRSPRKLELPGIEELRFGESTEAETAT